MVPVTWGNGGRGCWKTAKIVLEGQRRSRVVPRSIGVGVYFKGSGVALRQGYSFASAGWLGRRWVA